MKLRHDPLAAAATAKQIRGAAKEITQYPVISDDGNTFQFDEQSERAMRKASLYLSVNNSESIQWRLLDNSTLPVNRDDIDFLLSHLEMKQAERAVLVDREYVAFMKSGATLLDIEEWKLKYSP